MKTIKKLFCHEKIQTFYFALNLVFKFFDQSPSVLEMISVFTFMNTLHHLFITKWFKT